MAPQIPDKKRIARSFSNKAGTYGEYAAIQQTALEKLAGYARELPADTSPWIDLGCGTGLFETIAGIPHSRNIFYLDIAPQCLQKARTQRQPPAPAIVADIESLPLHSGTFAVAVMASVLQWLTEPSRALRAINAVLNSRGHLLFAVFLNNSFHELQQLQTKYGVKNPIRLFSLPECETLFSRSGFDILSREELRITFHYPTPLAALKSFVGTGSTALQGNRLNPKKLFSFCREYDTLHRTPQGIPVTCHMLVGKARKTGFSESTG
ncbi:MAG: methyltransferase domain-containing protein [Chitinivibrionales bacterium]|nr:methyltransferase domain-containing protein [Chitinivibrionales bacterium]